MKNALQLLLIAALIGYAVPAQAADPATESLYKTKCQACHAADGTGNTVVGKKMNVRDFHLPEIMKAPDKELIEITTKGKNKMPGFEKKLSADQIKALVAYIRECTKAKK